MLENWFRKSRSTQIVYETFGLYSSNSMIKLRVLQTAKGAVYTSKNYICIHEFGICPQSPYQVADLIASNL